MSNRKWTITYIHSTSMFYVETQIRRKPWNVFSYMYWRITFIGTTNFLCFPSTIARRLQTPSFSGYNLGEDPTPQFSGYNPLCSPTTTGRWIQQPILSLSNHRDVEVEWWNQYHTITMRYTSINLYQSTCTKQPVPITWTMHQPFINLYLNL